MTLLASIARVLALSVSMAWCSSSLAQQAYPSKPIRLIVPFPPGGSIDPVARMLAPKLIESWGQQVIVDKGYGVIRHIQDGSYGGRHFFDDLLGPNLEGLARLAGLPYWRVRKIDELGTHLSAALAKRGPTLVEVDMGAIGPFRPLHQAPQYGSKR